MANRYWVGGTDTWDSTAGTKWSTTSGGAGGAAVPTAADDVFFNAASGAVTCTVSGDRVCLSLNCTGFTGTLTATGLTPSLTISGSMTLATGMTLGGALDFTFTSNVTGRTINSAGISIGGALKFEGAGSWILQAPLTQTGGGTTLTEGTLDLNNYTLTVYFFNSNNDNEAREIQFGTGSIVIAGNSLVNFTSWNVGQATKFTLTGTPNVSLAITGSGTMSIAHGSSTDNPANASNAINIASLSLGASNNFAFTGHFKDVDLTGLTGNNAISNSTRTIYGDIVFDADAVLNAGTNTTTLAGTSGTQDITSNGKTLDFPITQNGAGGTVRLLDALTLGATRTYTLNRGVFNANNFNVTVGAFSSSNSNTRTITMGSGTWTLSGTGTVWDTATTTGLTFNKDTANITLSSTSTSGRTFAGGGLTYNNLVIGGSTGVSTLTFTGSNTFGTISSTKTVAQTFLFTAGTTTTVADWTVTGSAGNVLTIGSVGGAAQHTLAKTGGGTVVVNYASISYSNATPADTWVATNSTSVTGNTGWTFLQGSGFFVFF